MISQRRQATVFDAGARGALFLALGVPLFIWPGFFFPYVTVRGMLFRALVAVAGILVLFRALIADDVRRGRRDYVLLALCALVAAGVAASAFGVAWQRSLFGTFERAGGVWTWAHLVLLYALLRTTLTERDWRWYLRGVVVVGVLAAFYGLLQRYQTILGIRWIGDPFPPSGPIGNYGIYAGYLLFPIGVAAFSIFDEPSPRARRLSATALAVMLWVLYLASNRSSVLGLASGVFVAVVVYNVVGRRRYALAAGVLAVVLAVGGLLAAMRAGGPLESLSPYLPHQLARFVDTAPTSVGDDRALQRRAAVAAFAERPILGYGPENHEVLWSRHFDPRMYAILQDSYSADQRWDRTHNAFYESLATTGIVGFLALLSVWLAMLAAIERQRRAGFLTAAGAAALIGLNVAYAVYLWFWFYDLSALALWITVAGAVASREGSRLLSLEGVRPWRPQSVALAVASVVAGAALIHTYALGPLREARVYGRLQHENRATPGVMNEFTRVLASGSPYSATGVTLFRSYMTRIWPEFERKRADTAFVKATVRALRQSIVTAADAVAADPLNERLRITRGRILWSAGLLLDSDQLHRRAHVALQEGIALSPRRVYSRIALVQFFNSLERWDESLAQLDTIFRINPRSGPAYYYRAEVYTAIGRPELAATDLQNALRFGAPAEGAVAVRTAVEAAQSGRPALALDVARAYLVNEWGPYFQWRHVRPRSGYAERLALASMLPVLAEEAGFRDEAVASARALVNLCPRAAPVVERFARSPSALRALGVRWSILSASDDAGAIVLDVTRRCRLAPQ